MSTIQKVFSGDRQQIPERNLLTAILQRALADLRGSAVAGHYADRDARFDAQEWFLSVETTPFTFLWVCQELDLKADLLLDAIKRKFRLTSTPTTPKRQKIQQITQELHINDYPEWLTVTQAAKALKYRHPSSIADMVREGRIEHKKAALPTSDQPRRIRSLIPRHEIIRLREAMTL
jgi:hypothetical protein